MIRRLGLLVLMGGCLLALQLRGQDAESPAPPPLEILSGEPRLIVVNGYSTSFVWWRLLQRKLDRYFEGRRVIEVKPALEGGTPVARWMDVHSGEPHPDRLASWDEKLRPALRSKGSRPAIVLAQQSLQGVWGPFQEGIRGEQDRERIRQGADALDRFARLLLREGADHVFIAMHIYKHPMEPVIGNERLALAEMLARQVPNVYAGPDVWEPTRRHYPLAFARDRLHPNDIGAEIMAQEWFATLLRHDGLPAPEWSVEEMRQAIEQGASQ